MRLHETAYRSCGGVKFASVRVASCGGDVNFPLGSTYLGFNVTRVVDERSPFLWTRIAFEEAPAALFFQLNFLGTMASTGLIAITLAWEASVYTKVRVERELDELKRFEVPDQPANFAAQHVAVFEQVIADRIAEKKKETASSWYGQSLAFCICVSLFMPVYVLLYYRDALDLRYDVPIMLMSTGNFFTGAWALARTLQTPYLEYYQNYLAMSVISHTTLDFSDLHQLRLWRAIRKFYVHFASPVHYGVAQWCFVAFILAGVLTVAAVVVRSFWDGIDSFRDSGQQLTVMTAVTCVVFAYVILNRAVAVWKQQQSHILLLKDTTSLLHELHQPAQIPTGTHKRFSYHGCLTFTMQSRTG
jgi:hypothetical protein